MDVSSYIFSDEEIVRFKQYRDKQQDGRLRLRFMALIMLATGTTIKDMAHRCFVWVTFTNSVEPYFFHSSNIHQPVYWMRNRSA